MTVTSFGYRYRTTPRAHQAAYLEQVWQKPAWALFWEMRVGKGIATVYEMDALAALGHASRFLVVCPKRVISTWAEAIRAHATTPFRVVTDWQGLDAEAGPTVVVVNYEQVWTTRDHHTIVRPELVNWRPEYVVADEAHKIKNRTAKRSRALHLLGRVATYRRALTGTPTPTSYADLYSIYRFLDPTIFGSWAAFAGQFLVLNFYRQVVGYRNLDTLAQQIHTISSRVRRAECFDIPAVEEVTVPVTLPSEAARIYEQMAKDFYAELVEGGTVTAPIILTKLLRMAQITGGHVTRDDGSVQWIHSAKLDILLNVLEEVLADNGQKVVVYFQFRPEIERAADMIHKTLHTVPLQLHGGTRDDTQIRHAFHTDPARRVLLAQIASGSLGLDLSCAETAVLYSWGYDSASYYQARDRIWSPKNKVTYIHLVVPRSIDTTMLQVVQRKMDRSTLMLDNWQKIVDGGVE